MLEERGCQTWSTSESSREAAAPSSDTADIPNVWHHAPADVVPASRRTSGISRRGSTVSLVPTQPHSVPCIPSSAIVTNTKSTRDVPHNPTVLICCWNLRVSEIHYVKLRENNVHDDAVRHKDSKYFSESLVDPNAHGAPDKNMFNALFKFVTNNTGF